jgi:uncharacterized membrane protein YqjE
MTPHFISVIASFAVLIGAYIANAFRVDPAVIVIAILVALALLIVVLGVGAWQCSKSMGSASSESARERKPRF